MGSLRVSPSAVRRVGPGPARRTAGVGRVGPELDLATVLDAAAVGVVVERVGLVPAVLLVGGAGVLLTVGQAVTVGVRLHRVAEDATQPVVRTLRDDELADLLALDLAAVLEPVAVGVGGTRVGVHDADQGRGLAAGLDPLVDLEALVLRAVEQLVAVGVLAARVAAAGRAGQPVDLDAVTELVGVGVRLDRVGEQDLDLVAVGQRVTVGVEP